MRCLPQKADDAGRRKCVPPLATAVLIAPAGYPKAFLGVGVRDGLDEADVMEFDGALVENLGTLPAPMKPKRRKKVNQQPNRDNNRQRKED